MKEIDRLRAETDGMTAADLIAWAAERFGPSVVFASSLGAEDQVVTHFIAERARELTVFTLDTGRLFAQTYDLLEQTRARYGIEISVFFPDSGHVEAMVGERGPNLFYRSVEDRKRCCRVRKVEPLNRALAGRQAWMTGLRRAQSPGRGELQKIEWDELNGIVKLSPLADWSSDRVWQFIRDNDVPYHPLHDSGFPSIGCAPCTRAVKPGQDIRSGRWWWEQASGRECGLHSRDEAGADRDSVKPFGIRTLET